MSFMNSLMLPSRRRVVPLVAMVTGIFLAVASVIGLAAPAQAAAVPGAIKSVTVTPESPGKYEEITVQALWAVPNSAKPGDTFTLQLPVELDSLVSGFEIRNDQGELIATAAVRNGLVTFTLTDFVNTHKNVSGKAIFTTKLNRELEPGKPYVLEFGNEAEVTITPGGGQPVDRTSSQKYGFWIDPNGEPSSTPTDRIRWTVESPQGPFDRISFEDTVGPGLELECPGVPSAKMNFAETFQANGEVDQWGTDVVRDNDFAENFSAKCSGSTLTATGPAAGKGQILRLVYDTKVTDVSASSYKNTALVTVNGTTKPVESVFRRSTGSGNGQGDENSHTTTPVIPPTTQAPVVTTEPITASSSAPATTATPVTGEELANTGTSGLLLPALVGGLSLLVGAGLLMMRRRSH